jgi:methylphosphotriester-DNA--protein-cysteine methyltransferase
MILHNDINQTQLFSLLKSGSITLGGNKRLRIYGRLNCASGRRMKKKNRIFFIDEAEALSLDYRPCGYCMKIKYQHWKLSKKQVEKASVNLQF